MAFTDYPISELGDPQNKEAPIRECKPIDYDGNKYATVEVGGITTSFKSGYIYTTECRCGEGTVVNPKTYIKEKEQ